MVSLLFKMALALSAFFLLMDPAVGGWLMGWALVAAVLWLAWWLVSAVLGR